MPYGADAVPGVNGLDLQFCGFDLEGREPCATGGIGALGLQGRVEAFDHPGAHENRAQAGEDPQLDALARDRDGVVAGVHTGVVMQRRREERSLVIA